MSAPSSPPVAEEQATLPIEEGANLAPQPDTQTEAAPEGDRAVAPAEEAVASEPSELQVEVTPAPVGLTREEAERLFEEKAAAVRMAAVEEERNRRRTQAAREALAEKRANEERLEARDTVKAAFGAAGVYEIPDESVYTAIDRVASKKAAAIAAGQADLVDQAFDFVTAPIYGKEVDLDDSFKGVARKLAPKVQHLIDTARPLIEAEARKGWISEEDLPKRVDAEIARRNALKREGTEELQRVAGSPASTVDRSIDAVRDRIIGNNQDAEDERIWRERFGTRN